MREDTIQRPRHTGEIERADEQGRRADLATAACTHEATELFCGGPSPPLGLLLEGAERHQVALLFEHPFDRVIAETTDQLVLEVRVAHVETEIFHAVAGEIDAEARQFETAPEVAFFGGVAQAREPGVTTTGAEDVEGAPDVRRPADRYDRDAFGTEVSAATCGERLQRATVTEPFDEHDCASAFVIGELHSRNGTVGDPSFERRIIVPPPVQIGLDPMLRSSSDLAMPKPLREDRRNTHRRGHVDNAQPAGAPVDIGSSARVFEGGRIFALLALVGGVMTCWGAVRNWVFLLPVTASGDGRPIWLRPIAGPNPSLARAALAAGVVIVMCSIVFVALRRDVPRIVSMAVLILAGIWTAVVFHDLHVTDPLHLVPLQQRGLPVCGTAPCIEVITLTEWIEWGAWVAIFWGVMALVRAFIAYGGVGIEDPDRPTTAMTDVRVLVWLVEIVAVVAVLLYVGFSILYGMFAGDHP